MTATEEHREQELLMDLHKQLQQAARPYFSLAMRVIERRSPSFIFNRETKMLTTIRDEKTESLLARIKTSQREVMEYIVRKFNEFHRTNFELSAQN